MWLDYVAIGLETSFSRCVSSEKLLKKKLINFYILSLLVIKYISEYYFVPVAQLDRASDYESEGWEFDSLRARQKSFTTSY